MTGHSDGLITVNIAEADDAERERRRTTMHEPYRTLLGHMRHESGHYYWDRLIAPTSDDRRIPIAFRGGTQRLRCGAQHVLRPRRAGRLAGSVRQRVRELAPVGGLGRNVGPVSPYDRYARNCRRCRSFVDAAPQR